MDTLERLSERILVLRSVRVILDADLALLYGVPVKRLNEQVRRNRERFPTEFSFLLNNHEVEILKSQFATSSWGGKRKPPMAFTEHGAIMAATVLNSPRAIKVSVFVVRAFVQLRNAITGNSELGKRLDELERKIGAHDSAIGEILAAIRQLTASPEPQKRRRIGFMQD